MIRRLRRRHLVFGVSVLATAPALIALAIVVRAAEPRNEAMPGQDAGAPGTHLVGLPVEFRLDSTAGTFTFRATEPLHLPDPLLYWAATLPSDSAIPAGALLLGSLSPDRFTSAGAPLSALAPGGVLLIWDGGHGRFVTNGPAGLRLGGGRAP
ncbi:MAG: hypothetical protein OEW17_04530 [Gemmatimonadota bacterium]|nr:hypothetical protein [Gemmatimonadota bacterium]MDH4348049.1 hypothetical protein [Gemmatimonadota bacterium]MDH5282636.1 hypothetical protein [Gemmatimonadota bacterium]